MSVPLPCGISASVCDTHRRGIGNGCYVLHAHGQVEILKIEEIALIKTSHPFQYFSTKEHKATACNRYIQYRFGSCHVTHFIMIQPSPEALLDYARGKSTQEKIEHRRVSFAEVGGLSVRA